MKFKETSPKSCMKTIRKEIKFISYQGVLGLNLPNFLTKFTLI